MRKRILNYSILNSSFNHINIIGTADRSPPFLLFACNDAVPLLAAETGTSATVSSRFIPLPSLLGRGKGEGL